MARRRPAATKTSAATSKTPKNQLGRNEGEERIISYPAFAPGGRASPQASTAMSSKATASTTPAHASQPSRPPLRAVTLSGSASHGAGAPGTASGTTAG